MEIQILRLRYVDKGRLDRLLKDLFGYGNYEVEVDYHPKAHVYVLTLLHADVYSRT